MKTIINAYLSVGGLKDIVVQSYGDKPNTFDRVSLTDRIGNVLQLDAAIICKALETLAAARKLTVEEYLKYLKSVEV